MFVMVKLFGEPQFQWGNHRFQTPRVKNGVAPNAVLTGSEDED
jgi:hypothetical protein